MITPSRTAGAIVGLLAAGAIGIATQAADASPTVAGVDRAMIHYGELCGAVVHDYSLYDESASYRRWWDGLVRHGWRGTPADGIEAIYPPGCISGH